MKYRQLSALVWLTAVCSSACGGAEGAQTPATAPMNNAVLPTATPSANAAGRSANTPVVTPTNPSAGTMQPAAAQAGAPARPAVTPGSQQQPSASGSMAPAMTAQAGGAAPAANSGNAGSMSAPGAAPAGGAWAAADPAKMGPFATVTEQMVGPGMAYTMVRPRDLMRRHPVITWGNGTGTTPPTYRSLTELYASHGFIVIASNSMNVAQGDPPPMLDGVTWVLEQDMTMGSALFERVDRENIGATGHSQGAFAASSAGVDARIKSIAPIQALGASRGLHGAALGLCGTMDMTVPCTGNMRSFSAIADQPVMYAELKAADHTNWIFSPSGAHPYAVITNAWFRVHLMGDTALRPLFYGADCTYCKDDAWVIMRKMMD